MKLKKTLKKALSFSVAVICCVLYCASFPIAYGNDFSDESASFDDLLRERSDKNDDEVLHDNSIGASDISDFEDVNQDDWFYPYLDMLVSKGLIKGKTPTSFEPSQTFSYAECCTVIVRYLGLENEAKDGQRELISVGCPQSNLWYSGYVYVIWKLGIFDNIGLYEADGNGSILISTEKAAQPVKRYEFAKAIAQSFELDGSLRAKNVFSEIGGLGHEFIPSGFYDTRHLQQYEIFISDFDSIPETAQEYVLKAYYCGIFNGDISGNFYPDANLKRSEMAKVLAAITDYSYRTFLSDGYFTVLSEDKFTTDSLGNRQLSYEYAEEILQSQAQNIFISDNTVTYSPAPLLPPDYCVDLFLYGESGEMWDLQGKQALSCGDVNGYAFSHELECENARILLVLRSMKDNGQCCCVLDIRISDGQIIQTLSTARAM